MMVLLPASFQFKHKRSPDQLNVLRWRSVRIQRPLVEGVGVRFHGNSTTFNKTLVICQLYITNTIITLLIFTFEILNCITFYLENEVLRCKYFYCKGKVDFKSGN